VPNTTRSAMDMRKDLEEDEEFMAEGGLRHRQRWLVPAMAPHVRRAP
jgi:hypothetical protein